MIDPKELRLGNYVTGFDKYGSYGQILSIWDNQRRTDIIYDRPEVFLKGGLAGGQFAELDPIPLTPEILDKCGFENDRLIFKWDGEDEITVEHSMNPESSLTFPCKSLHQLQNLYFALTGEELTVKLSEPVNT